MFKIYLYVQFLLVTNLFNMKMYLFSEINFYSITDLITFIILSLLCFYLLKLLGKFYIWMSFINDYIIRASQARCSHWCNTGMAVMG